MEKTGLVTAEISFSEFLGIISILNESMYPGATGLANRLEQLVVSPKYKVRITAEVVK